MMLSRRVLRWLLPPEKLRVLESEMQELHERRVAREGRAPAERRIRQEWRRALWHVLLDRLAGSVAGPPDAPKRGPRPPLGAKKARPGADLLADTRQAMRTVRRRPGFVIAVALVLGIGVGATGSVFAMANQLLLRPLPGVADPGGAAYVDFHSGDGGGMGLSGPDVEELRRSATLLAGFATYDGLHFQASAAGTRPVAVEGVTVYGDYFELLGVRPAEGRLLGAPETGPDADPFVAVISERLREALFGGDGEVVGRTFQANGHTFAVVGVAGGGFTGTDASWPVDAWLPRSAFVPLEGFPRERLWSRDSRLNQWFIARPRAGVALEAAEAQLETLLAGLADSDPEHREHLSELRAALYPGLLPPRPRERVRETLGVLGGAVGLLLLITCANASNLLLVRGIQGRGDVAVHRALGASAGRVVRQRLLESLLLAVAGAVTGLVVAWGISLMFRGVSLSGLPGFEGFVLDVRVLAFAAAAVLFTTLLFGAAPAALAGRFELQRTLRDADSHATGRHGGLRQGLSTIQVGLTLALLVGAVLLTRTVQNVYSVDSGLALEGVAALTLDLGRSDRRAAGELDRLHRALLEAVEDAPGVRSAALHSWLGPFSGGSLTTRVARPEAPDAEAEMVRKLWVSPQWFDLFGVRATRGRVFRAEDWGPSSTLGVVVTAALAERWFGDTEPVGRTLRIGFREMDEVRIIGVVGDVRTADLRRPPDEAVFLPYPKDPDLTSHLTILFRGSEGRTLAAVEEAVGAVVPDLPVPAPAPLTDRIDAQLTEQRVFARLLALLSGLALLLASVGLYGVVAFAVAGRRRELGIRLALGADGRRIAALVLRSAAGIVAVGTSLGLAGAYGLSRLIESRLFGVAAVDLPSYVAAAGLLAAVSVLACMLPARAAIGTDAVETLRSE